MSQSDGLPHSEALRFGGLLTPESRRASLCASQKNSSAALFRVRKPVKHSGSANILTPISAPLSFVLFFLICSVSNALTPVQPRQKSCFTAGQ